MPPIKRKAIGILIALIIAAGVGMFLFGQEVLGQEAVVAELNMNVSPVASSPLSDISISVEARAYRARVSVSAMRRGLDVAEVSKDKIAEYGASVQFEKNITIYNATGDIVFQHVLSFSKGVDREFTIYLPTSEVKPGANMTIVIDIELELTLPTPGDTLPVPGTIKRTVHEEIIVPVEES